MATTPDPATIETRARALLDSRIDSVRTLATSRQAMHDAAEQLAAAQAADLKAFNAAVAGGWTATELGKLGFDEPATQRQARRRQRNTSKQTAQTLATERGTS